MRIISWQCQLHARPSHYYYTPDLPTFSLSMMGEACQISWTVVLSRRLSTYVSNGSAACVEIHGDFNQIITMRRDRVHDFFSSIFRAAIELILLRSRINFEQIIFKIFLFSDLFIYLIVLIKKYI